MAQQRRNPFIGGLLALVFIGFGSYRFYVHFMTTQELETWQLIISGGLILYGLFVIYSIIKKS